MPDPMLFDVAIWAISTLFLCSRCVVHVWRSYSLRIVIFDRRQTPRLALSFWKGAPVSGADDFGLCLAIYATARRWGVL
jgi:hypothetical protein